MTPIAAPLDLVCMGRAAVDLYGEQIGGRLEDMQHLRQVPGRLAGQHRGRRVAPGPARRRCSAASATSTTAASCARRWRARVSTCRWLRTDPTRLTALVFLGIRDRDTFPLVFYREHCADMGLCVDDIDAGVHRSARGAAGLGHAPVAPRHTRAACLRAMHAARAAGTRVVLDIDYRPGAVGADRAGAGRAALRRLGRRSAAAAAGRAAAVRPGRRHRGRGPHRRRQQRQPGRAAPHPRGHAGADRDEARADGLRRLSPARFPSDLDDGVARPGLPGRGVQRARRRRRVHGRPAARLGARRAAGRCAALCQRLRRDRRVAPRLRAGDAELGRSCRTSSRHGSPHRACAKTPSSNNCTARTTRQRRLAGAGRAGLRPPRAARRNWPRATARRASASPHFKRAGGAAPPSTATRPNARARARDAERASRCRA